MPSLCRKSKARPHLKRFLPAQTLPPFCAHTNAATPPKRQAKPARRPPAHAAQGPAQAPTATPEKDQWLYLAVPEPTAAEYLAHGITLSRTHPLLLATLRGMQAWLAKLHEQEDPEQLGCVVS
ncbi:MAG: hypothetical protein ABF611_11600 [Acetobacter orientalis]|uniref:hypothetical protein n=1 Tax=Acetobacter orientalis TaxID=146474 RepID=UPI0039E9B526